MKPQLGFALAVLAVLGAVPGAQAADRRLVIERVTASTANPLDVTSSAFSPGGAIPKRYSAYGESISPPLAWSGVPEGTKSFALVLEDPDAPMATPFVHWVVFDIDAKARALPEGLPAGAALSAPVTLRQGHNSLGKPAYFGPRPPHGDNAHHYHFELFALDSILPESAGKSRDALAAAIGDHVLAKGQAIGTFTAPR